MITTTRYIYMMSNETRVVKSTVIEILAMISVVSVILVGFIIQNDAARILAVFPVPSISHQVVFRPLTQELAKRGHEVIVITTDPAFPKGKTPTNLTEIDFHDVAYYKWKIIHASATGDPDDLEQQLVTILDLMTEILEEMLQTDEIKRLMYEDNKFDLILAEACVKPVLGISHPIKAPVIQLSSFGAVYDNYPVIGAPIHTFLYPSLLRQRINNLTLWEKLVEFYNFVRMEMMVKTQGKLQDAMLKRVLGPDTPSLEELANNVDLLILNNYPLWDTNRPVPPSVVFMGGIHQKPEKSLSTDLQKLLDSSKNGVVYVSFGTNASPSMLPPEKIQVLLTVFTRLPYDVLFKWDKDELPGLPDNVIIAKFFPQSDVLRHPKIKAFLTQGGLQSTDEAILAEVPLVCIPMLGDQWYNAEKYVHLGIGIKLDLAALTVKELEASLHKVIDDESYKKNIARLNKLLHDQPESPLDRAIWWIEHVIRNGGGSHLRSPAANISWAEYLELELVGVVVVVLLAVGTIVVVGGCRVVRMFRGKEKLKRS